MSSTFCPNLLATYNLLLLSLCYHNPTPPPLQPKVTIPRATSLSSVDVGVKRDDPFHRKIMSSRRMLFLLLFNLFPDVSFPSYSKNSNVGHVPKWMGLQLLLDTFHFFFWRRRRIDLEGFKYFIAIPFKRNFSGELSRPLLNNK